MKKANIFPILVFFIILTFSKSGPPTLTIGRARSHQDMSGAYTPLDVSLLTEDISTKVKPVDLFCILDTSSSMRRNAIELAKESLKYLINLMDESDNFALVTFSSSSKVVNDLTRMTEENKTLILNIISDIYAYGNTNIYSGLEKCLNLLRDDYSSGERIASIILLSDGYDNHFGKGVVNSFKNLLENTGKTDYVFTLHSFGYGDSYDYELLNEIALIKDGSFFNIAKLSDVGDAFLKIYGSLSTVVDVNIELKIQSKFNIIDVYGKEDMHNASITNDTISSFNVKLIQVIYGKKYDFVLLVDIPYTTPLGTEVLNAKVSKLDLFANYLWDGKFSLPAYEEYIRCIVVIFLFEGYNKKSTEDIDNGMEWIRTNYNGTRNWVKELDEARGELLIGGNSRYANLLSKITELKTSRIGAHFDEGNSYERQLISNSHSLNIDKLEKIEVRGKKIINYIATKNYYYFYLNEGEGKINNIPFSGKTSSFIIYSDDTYGQIDIISDDFMELYFDNQTVHRIQNRVDFNSVGIFIIKKEFPFDFYTRVDGKRDITFNIEFTNLDIKIEKNSNIYELLEIYAYILSDNDIDQVANDENELYSFKKFKGEFNKELNMGKFVIKQKDISDNLNSIYNNYLYIIINKAPGITSEIIKEAQGQFFFIPNNYIFSSVPENKKVFSHIEQSDNSAHIYTLEIILILIGDSFKIEFELIDNDELDIRILNYQDVVDNKIDLYNDYIGYKIERRKIANKIFLTVSNKDYNKAIDNKIILSIFSTNKDHVPTTNLSYAFKYENDRNDQIKETSLAETDNEIFETNNETLFLETTNIIEQTTQIIVNQIRVILLGFARYSYITSNKIINFFIYFVYVEKTVYTKKISIKMNIRYKSNRRYLQIESEQKGECILVEDDSLNQKKYNCSVNTNGEEIDSIQLDKNISADDNDINLTDIEISPIALNNINNIQNVGDQDPFDGKALYILDQSEINVNNDINELNLTGIMNNNKFEYDKINLDMALTENSLEKTESITCTTTKQNNKYNLQCNTKNEMSGKLNSAYSNLGNANLIVNIPEQNKKEINFSKLSSETSSHRFFRKKSGGLSAGKIVAIIIPCVIVLISAIGLSIYFYKKKSKIPVENSSTIIKYSS